MAFFAEKGLNNHGQDAWKDKTKLFSLYNTIFGGK